MASCCISSVMSAFLIMAFLSRTPLFSTTFSAMIAAFLFSSPLLSFPFLPPARVLPSVARTSRAIKGSRRRIKGERLPDIYREREASTEIALRGGVPLSDWRWIDGARVQSTDRDRDRDRDKRAEKRGSITKTIKKEIVKRGIGENKKKGILILKKNNSCS